MLDAAAFLAASRTAGFTLWTGVPCSYLTSFIDGVIADPDTRYLPAANEGDAVAIGAGASPGRHAVDRDDAELRLPGTP